MSRKLNAGVIALSIGVLCAGIHTARDLHAANRALEHTQSEVTGIRSQLDEAQRQTKASVAILPMRETQPPSDPVASSGDAVFDDHIRELLRRVYALRKRLDRDATQQFPELRYVTDGAWFEAASTSETWTDDAIATALVELRQKAQFSFLELVHRALQRYAEENQGALPHDPRELAPYFSGPADENALAHYEMVATGRASDVPADAVMLAERMSPAEREDAEEIMAYGMRVQVRSTAAPGNAESRAERKRSLTVFQAIDKFRETHHGESPTDVQQLRPYVKDPAMLNGVQLIENGFSYRGE